MTPSEPLSDVVAQQYQKWIYPEPIQDLPGWLANNWQWFDPSHAHRIFWPDRPYRPELEILIAGCGTNQAAVFAYTNPGARVVAIDVSESSLNHHRFLQQTYGLRNLELHQLPIEEVGALHQEFDLVVSTGVLHHMASPEQGMQALASCLKPDGVAAIMLYARYGRIGVEIMQAIFREIGLNQDEDALAMVREALASLPADHPVCSYLSFAPDLRFDAGLVDTFLHGRDRSYSVADCLDLVASAGLAFQGWFLKSPYEPATSATTPTADGFRAAVAALPNRQRWGVMERINTRNACHFFTACRADRPMSSYAIDLQSPQGLEAIPHFRYRCGVDGERIVRPGWSTTLTPKQLALVRLIDGSSTIGMISETANGWTSGSENPEEPLQFTRELFEFLINRDFVSLTQPSQQ